MFHSLTMKRAVILAAFCTAACIGGGQARAQAPDPVYFEVDNLTNSGGDPNFPVVSDVTFSNLALRETFADNFQQLLPLYLDPTNLSTQQDSLNTQDLSLFTSPVSLPDGAHGALTQLTITGLTDQSLLELQTSLNGPSTFVQTGGSFSTNLFGPNPAGIPVGLLSEIDATNNNIIAQTPIQVTPEGSSLTMLATCGLGMLTTIGLRRRSRRK